MISQVQITPWRKSRFYLRNMNYFVGGVAGEAVEEWLKREKNVMENNIVPQTNKLHKWNAAQIHFHEPRCSNSFHTGICPLYLAVNASTHNLHQTAILCPRVTASWGSVGICAGDSAGSSPEQPQINATAGSILPTTSPIYPHLVSDACTCLRH